MKDNFLLNDLKINSKGETIVIKGTAVVANKVHAHAFTMDGNTSFRSYFTSKALDKMKQDLKYRPVFIDALHNISTKLNNDWIIENIVSRYPELDKELSTIKSNLQVSDIPMFKLSDYEFKDDELIVTVESNPLYKEVDDSHKKTYEIITESINNGAINGFSIDFVPKQVTSENGIDKIDDLDLMGISLVNSPALGSSTSIAEVATRSIKKLVEIRTGETQMVEDKVEPQKVPNIDVNEIVKKQVEEQLKAREIEALKQRTEEENKRLRDELEALKKERTTADVGSKGTPKVDKNMSFEEFKSRVENLSESDQIRLYAEFVTNDTTHRAPPLIKKAVHRGKPGDPRITWEYESPSGSMLEMYQNIMKSKDSDMRF